VTRPEADEAQALAAQWLTKAHDKRYAEHRQADALVGIGWALLALASGEDGDTPRGDLISPYEPPSAEYQT
jgi:hypothetical protein